MRDDDLGPALAWAEAHAGFLAARSSPLTFRLHRSQYVRLLLSDSLPLPASLATPMLPPAPPVAQMNGRVGADASPAAPPQGPQLAYAYAREHFQPFLGSVHAAEIQRLMCAALFLPLERLLRSPYADIFAPSPDARPRAAPADELDGGDAVMADGERPPSVASRAPAPTDPADLHAPHLAPLFTAEYCAFIKRSREPALKVATDIGGGGALSRLAKVRSVMKERRTEWTQAGELPVSVFPCERADSADRDPLAARIPLPLGLLLPSQQGAGQRPQSAHDARLWTCHCQGEPGETVQGRPVRR